MWPWELTWLDGFSLSSYVWLIMVENVLTVVGLGLVALNIMWLWIRMDSVPKKKTKTVIAAMKYPPATPWPNTPVMANEVVTDSESSNTTQESDDQIEVENHDSKLAIELVRANIKNERLVAKLKEQDVKHKKHSEENDIATVALSEELTGVTAELRSIQSVLVASDDVSETVVNRLRIATRALQTANSAALDHTSIDKVIDSQFREAFSIRDTLDALHGNFQSIAKSRDLDLGCSVSRSVPTAVLGDMSRIVRVLEELVGNALQYTKAGSVSIFASVFDGADSTLKIKFEVRDTGDGFSPEQHMRFYSLTSGNAEDREQSVVDQSEIRFSGLKVADRMIKRIGGSLQIKSRLGEGSVFYFILDLPEVDAAQIDFGKNVAPSNQHSTVSTKGQMNKAVELGKVDHHLGLPANQPASDMSSSDPKPEDGISAANGSTSSPAAPETSAVEPVASVQHEAPGAQHVEVVSTIDVANDEAESQSQSQQINPKAIDTIRSLQRPGKPDLLGKVIELFLQKTPGSVQEMQDALGEGDMNIIKANAHSLKSSCAYVGADKMAVTCKQIEKNSAEDNQDELKVLIDALTAEYEIVAAELTDIAKAA